jgi:hypothetical protein
VEIKTLYHPNMKYFNEFWIKKYAGYPQDEPVYALIPHGVQYNNHVNAIEMECQKNGVMAVLSYPEYMDESYAAAGMEVVPSCSPWLYLVDMAPPEEIPVEVGCTYFPMHGTAKCLLDTDFFGLASELKSMIPKEYHPVRVCLHENEMVYKKHFRDFGVQVVTCGKPYNDPDFLLKLYYYIKTSKTCASNGVGSNLFYSMAAGTPYFLVGESPGMDSPNPELFHWDEDHHVRVQEVDEQFREIHLNPTQLQIDMVRYYLGGSRFKKPEEMKAILEDLKERYGKDD